MNGCEGGEEGENKKSGRKERCSFEDRLPSVLRSSTNMTLNPPINLDFSPAPIVGELFVMNRFCLRFASHFFPVRFHRNRSAALAHAVIAGKMLILRLR